MKTASRRLALLCLAMLVTASILPNFGSPISSQEKPETELAGDVLFFRWNGEPDLTYFVRTSSNMHDWDFIPEIEHGEGDFYYGFEATNDNLFVQLLYTNDSALIDGEVNPEEVDFDGDGLPSLYELLNGFNPLDSQTVDGIADGSGDIEMDGRIDNLEMGGTPSSHPSRIDNPKVQLRVEVFN